MTNDHLARRRRGFTLLIATILAIGILPAGALAGGKSQPTSSEGPWVLDWNQKNGANSQDCSGYDGELRPESGWIHWVFTGKGESTADGTSLTLGGTGSGTYDPGHPLNAEVWHFYTPYYEVDGLTATITLNGAPAKNAKLVISDYCPVVREELKVTKTADTNYTRTHDWSIEKSVDPDEIWLWHPDATGGSSTGSATWTVDVTYEGYEDSDYFVDGTITIENTGYLDATVLTIVDTLDGHVLPVECSVSLPATISHGEQIICTYAQEPGETMAEGPNSVVVMTEVDEYGDEAAVVWGEPTTEHNKDATITDSVQGTLGTVSAPNGDQFTYEADFAWGDYGNEECGTHEYPNIAYVKVGDTVLDQDDALLTVHVQCLIFKGETAWAANGDQPLQLPYNALSGGNWATYVEYAEKTTNVYAGQFHLAGTATFGPVIEGMVKITVDLTGDWEYDSGENLKVQGYSTAPSGNPAPGQFANKKTCSDDPCDIWVPAANYYGVHLDVGVWVPDPTFGPLPPAT